MLDARTSLFLRSALVCASVLTILLAGGPFGAGGGGWIAAAWAQDGEGSADKPDPSAMLEPTIDEPVRSGDEVELRGTAPPGTLVVATMGAQKFQTRSDDAGRWWLKFTPGSARAVKLTIGDYEREIELNLPKAEREVRFSVDDKKKLLGPVVSLSGTASENLVVTLLAGDSVIDRAQPRNGAWQLGGTIPQGIGNVAVIATDAAGEMVARKMMPIEWGTHRLEITYPKSGRIAAPFAVRGTTTPGERVSIEVGEQTVETVADETGTFAVGVPPPPRGTVELTASVAQGTERAASGTVSLEVVNRTKPPMGSLILGNIVGTLGGAALGAGFSWWIADLMYDCSGNCVVTERDAKTSAAIWGANWGMPSIGPTVMHLISKSQGFEGAYLGAAATYGTTLSLVWVVGGYAIAATDTRARLFPWIGVTAAGAVVGGALSTWVYMARGDLTRRRLNRRRMSLTVTPGGVGIAGSW